MVKSQLLTHHKSIRLIPRTLAVDLSLGLDLSFDKEWVIPPQQSTKIILLKWSIMITVFEFS